MHASQPSPSRCSSGRCHVAFAGDRAWVCRMRREKKIRKLALMKTRSTVSPHPQPPSAMNLERRERRRIKVNSNHSSSATLKALKCKCACVSFSLWFPLSSPALLFFFYERMGKAFKHYRLTHCWLVWWALFEEQSLKQALRGLFACCLIFLKPGIKLPGILFLVLMRLIYKSRHWNI